MTSSAGRAALLVGDAQDPPGNIGEFDAFFCCNVWLFWDDATTTVEHLAQQPNLGGRLAITRLPRHRRADRANTDNAADQIEAQMRQARLARISRSYLGLDPAPAVCIIATAPN